MGKGSRIRIMKNKNLEKALNIEAVKEEDNMLTEVEPEVVDLQPIREDDPDPRIDEDYEKARTLLHEIVENGGKFIDDAHTVAELHQKPSGFDSLANVIKSVSNSAKELMELSKIKKESEPEKQPIVNNNNAIFTGSTSDLLKMLKESDEASS